MMNAQWARRQGYEHLTYCISQCTATYGDGSFTAALASAWCKLPVLADVLQTKLHDTVLYLDSDAFWNGTQKSGLEALGRFMWPGDWLDSNAGGGSIFFGCNLPWNGEDRGRRQWNRSWVNGNRGPANTGAMLLRRDAAALATLTEWWRTPFSMPRWNQKHQWEQSALWEIWRTKPSFASALRVLSDPASGDCMRTMDRRRPSLIAHIPGGGRSVLSVRESYFLAADPRQRLRATPWSTMFVELGKEAQVVPPSALHRRCVRRLSVDAHAATVRMEPCG